MFIFGAANKEEQEAIKAMGHELLRVATPDQVNKFVDPSSDGQPEEDAESHPIVYVDCNIHDFLAWLEESWDMNGIDKCSLTHPFNPKNNVDEG